MWYAFQSGNEYKYYYLIENSNFYIPTIVHSWLISLRFQYINHFSFLAENQSNFVHLDCVVVVVVVLVGVVVVYG